MLEWEPEIGETLDTKQEPLNEYDRFAVAVLKNNQIVGHLSQGESGRFAKTVFRFLNANDQNICQVEIRGKRTNPEGKDREGLQVPCILCFTGQNEYIEMLKKHLPS